MKNRIYVKGIAMVFCLIGITALMIAGFGLAEYVMDRAENNRTSDEAFSYSEYNGKQIYYESVRYIPNDAVESLLILGIDKKADGTEKRQNSEQADFLAVVVMNREEESYTILYLNRDTMTEIPETDAFGEIYGHRMGQLALAHTYGKEEKVRCRNTVNTVENLLYGIDIDHYLSMTMDAIPILNDSVGGVTVSLMDDFTDLDETYVKDAVVTLWGEQALTYVQARGELKDNTNLHRMERQKQYISALLDKLGSYDSEYMTDAMMKVTEYLVSDCTIDQLSKRMERMGNYTCEGTVSLEGEAVRGTDYMEYHMDEQAAQALVVKLFYKPLE